MGACLTAARALALAALAAWALLAACAAPAAASQAGEWVVAVRADLRPAIADGRFDPARDAVGLRGGTPPLSWQQPLLLRPLGDGVYAGEVRFAQRPAQPVAHKLRIEREGQGDSEGWERGPNRQLRVDGAGPGRIARAFDAPPDDLVLQRTGTIQRLGRIASVHVAPREVQVWLPPGYGADPARRHPVLYLHDGQNMFDALAAGAEWGVDETAQRLVAAGAIEPPLIVAVASGPDRMRDYTPTAMPDIRTPPGAVAPMVGGGAAAYARFLVEELKPLIDTRYRTRPEAAHTALGGSSLGGLVSLWLALQHPQVFGAALVVSPSLWWDDALPLRQVQALDWRHARRPRLWLDVGHREGVQAVADTRRLRDALLRQGWAGADLAYHEAPEGDHDEASWAARVGPMLRFLYPAPSPAPATPGPGRLAR